MAKHDVMVHLDLNKQELLNAKLQNLATPPTLTATDAGFTYWNTADNTAYSWTGTSWLDLGAVYTHPTYTGTGQPATALSGANVISRITLENGHVTGVTTRALTPANIGAAAAVHTHAFGDITSLPANTILANNTTALGAAKAITVSDLMTMLAIGYGTDLLLTTGTDTTQRTWTAKQLKDFVNSAIAGFLTVVNLSYTASATNGVVTNSAGTNATISAATSTLAGLLLPAEKTKLAGIEAGANNYVHPTVNPGAHPFASELTSGLQVLSQMIVNSEGHVVTIKGRNLTAADLATVIFNNSVNNGTNTTWTSTKIYSEIQAAINQAQTGALQYKGNYDPATNTPNLGTDATIKTGYTYVVTTTGTFAGQTVEAGDMIIAKIDNPGTTAANWQIVNKNIPAIVSATTTVEGILYLATNAEAIAGTNTTKAVTPAGIKAFYDAKLGAYTALFGDGSTTTYTITHGLNSIVITPMVQRVSDGAFITCDIKAASATTVTVGLNIAPANNAYRVIINRMNA